MALDRARLAQIVAPFALGARDPDLPVWPIFKRGINGDTLIAQVFDYADVAPLPAAQARTTAWLVALSPSGAFLEVLVDQRESGLWRWLRPTPRFAFLRHDENSSLAAPASPQEVIARSRDLVRARLNLQTPPQALESAP